MLDLRGVAPIASGASAVVFRVGGQVVKVFHAPGHPSSPLSRFRTECVRAIFEAEVEAWIRIQGSRYLVQHTPRFYGATKVTGLDATRLLTDCRYVIEYIAGDAAKVDNWEPPHLAQATNEFARVGVGYWTDASCFELDDPTKFRLVDLATRDVIGEDECCFDETGR